MMVSLAALAIGFCIDAVLGDPHSIPHPVRWIGMLISALENRLRRRFASAPRGELWAGSILVLIVLMVSVLLPTVLLCLANWVSVYLRLAVESVMCWQILAAKSLRDESMSVQRALERGDVESARAKVSMIVGRDTAALDAGGIARAAVETVAENASDGVAAPMLYTLLGGAPLGFFYKAANTMDSMLGYRNEKYLYFGRAAARVDDVLHSKPYIGDDTRPIEPGDIRRANRLMYASAILCLLLFGAVKFVALRGICGC